MQLLNYKRHFKKNRSSLKLCQHYSNELSYPYKEICEEKYNTTYKVLLYVALMHNVELCYFVFLYVMLRIRYVMSCYAMLYYVTLHYAMLCYVTLRCFTLRYITLCYVMLCHIMFASDYVVFWRF